MGSRYSEGAETLSVISGVIFASMATKGAPIKVLGKIIKKE